MALDGQNYASGWLLHSFLRVVEGLLKEKARKVVVGGSRSSCLFSTVFMMNKDVSLVSNEMLGTILQILNNHYCSLFSFSSFYHVSVQLFPNKISLKTLIFSPNHVREHCLVNVNKCVQRPTTGGADIAESGCDCRLLRPLPALPDTTLQGALCYSGFNQFTRANLIFVQAAKL